MATDIADWTSSVVVQSGVVSISGIATVSISGTPTVTISGTPSVNIANTPSVTISSGSVTIANASIGVINAAGTKITSARPPKRLLNLADNPNPNTATVTLDADVQALVVNLPWPLSGYVHLRIAWHDSGGAGSNWVPLELYKFTQNVYVIPIVPAAIDQVSTVQTSLDVTFQGTNLGGQAVELIELFESAPLWLQLYPTPQLTPNQLPLLHATLALATVTAAWVIAPVANVQINLFELTPTFITGVAAAYIYGHSTTLPVAGGGTEPQRLYYSGNSGSFLNEYHGAALPRGEGLWVWNDSANVLTVYTLVTYSLS